MDYNLFSNAELQDWATVVASLPNAGATAIRVLTRPEIEARLAEALRIRCPVFWLGSALPRDWLSRPWGGTLPSVAPPPAGTRAAVMQSWLRWSLLQRMQGASVAQLLALFLIRNTSVLLPLTLLISPTDALNVSAASIQAREAVLAIRFFLARLRVPLPQEVERLIFIIGGGWEEWL